MAGHKPLIIETCKAEGLLRNECAYVLATAYWESNRTFEPVREAYYLQVKDPEAWRKKNLRYWPWYGRGFVQLTWERNYRKAGDAIGVNLLADPDLALDPHNAALILVRGMRGGWFTGKRLSDYFDLKRSNWIGARRIVNGLDKADDIRDLAIKYDAELLEAGYGVETPSAPSKPATDVPGPSGGVSGWLILLATAIAAAFAAGWGWLTNLFGF